MWVVKELFKLINILLLTLTLPTAYLVLLITSVRSAITQYRLVLYT